MPPRNNSKTSKKAAEQSQTVMGGLRKFLQRLCIFGLVLIGMLLVYFLMGGDSRKLTGVKDSGEKQTDQTDQGVAYSVGKPAMDENGNPTIRKVSEGSEMFESELDEMLSSGDEPDYSSTGSKTSPGFDDSSDYGSSDSETSQNAGTGASSEGTPMAGTPSSDPSGTTSENSGSTWDYSGGSSSGSDYSSGSGSGYSSGSGSDYSSGSGSGYSSGSGSGYSSGSGSDYSSGSGSGYSSGSGSGYSSGSGSGYSSGSGSGYSSGSGSDYSSGSGSGYSSGSGSDYSSGSGSGYSSGSGSDYSSGSGSGYSGGSSYDSSAGLNTGTSSSGANVDTSQESVEDFFPKTNPIKNYKEGVVTGPDGKPRRDEVKILEVGRGEPVKNHFGPAVTDFLDLFDFSITPDWVEANWSSVAIVGPLTTRGYRVPISTGPEPSDLVGSLTYYFNNRLELEKITFEGYTGDLDRLLISLKYFNMSKRITSDPNALLYLSEELPDNRRSFLKSYFRLQPHDKTAPNRRYWVTLELYPPEK